MTTAGISRTSAGPIPARLEPLAGPELPVITLKPGAPMTIGRHEQCDIRLASESVSRYHAQLRFEKGHWRLTDLKSRWGTFINGRKVQPDIDIPLESGDLIRITPWTLCFSTDAAPFRPANTADDMARNQTLVTSVKPQRVGNVAEELLALLLESAASMQAADTMDRLAESLLDSAIRGTGLPNASVLRPIDAHGHVEILASRSASGETNYSRSLLAAAAKGTVAQFAPNGMEAAAQSIVMMKIEAALCVPLMLGETVAAFLYLDARGDLRATATDRWASATAFCVALGRIAGLAMAGLKRVDMERRAMQIEAELSAAAEAQRWVMPHRDLDIPPFKCVGESRPGRYVGGDFFDVIPLPDGRLVIAVGDVAGKGVPAAILMTAAQGFLHAALHEHGDPEAAVNQLNAFLGPRRAANRFVTAWVGVLDPAAHTLKYVDAGHGYAMLIAADTEPQLLNEGDNVPVGITDDTVYRAVTVALPPAGRLLVVSDGIIEQPAPETGDANARAEFGIDGIRAMAHTLLTEADPIKPLFDAVIKHGGSPSLADDTTALLVHW